MARTAVTFRSYLLETERGRRLRLKRQAQGLCWSLDDARRRGNGEWFTLTITHHA